MRILNKDMLKLYLLSCLQVPRFIPQAEVAIKQVMGKRIWKSQLYRLLNDFLEQEYVEYVYSKERDRYYVTTPKGDKYLAEQLAPFKKLLDDTNNLATMDITMQRRPGRYHPFGESIKS